MNSSMNYPFYPARSFAEEMEKNYVSTSMGNKKLARESD